MPPVERGHRSHEPQPTAQPFVSALLGDLDPFSTGFVSPRNIAGVDVIKGHTHERFGSQAVHPQAFGQAVGLCVEAERGFIPGLVAFLEDEVSVGFSGQSGRLGPSVLGLFRFS